MDIRKVEGRKPLRVLLQPRLLKPAAGTFPEIVVHHREDAHRQATETPSMHPEIGEDLLNYLSPEDVESIPLHIHDLLHQALVDGDTRLHVVPGIAPVSLLKDNDGAGDQETTVNHQEAQGTFASWEFVHTVPEDMLDLVDFGVRILSGGLPRDLNLDNLLALAIRLDTMIPPVRAAINPLHEAQRFAHIGEWR